MTGTECSLAAVPALQRCSSTFAEVDFIGSHTYHRAPMPDSLPDDIDPWRMVQARREFRGTLPVAVLTRLRESLADDVGEVTYAIMFRSDDFGTDSIRLELDAVLTLTCQRLLQPFKWPLSIVQNLGLIRDEAGESALPEGFEPLLVEDGHLNLKDVIEDELILALPVVALSPGAPIESLELTRASADEQDVVPSPFAALGKWKDSRH